MVVFVEVAYLFNCRSLTGRAISLGLFTNPWLIGGVSLTIVLQLLLTYAPAMNTLFGTAAIDLATWLKILGVAILAWCIVEMDKAARRRHGGRRRRTSRAPQAAERPG